MKRTAQTIVLACAGLLCASCRHAAEAPPADAEVVTEACGTGPVDAPPVEPVEPVEPEEPPLTPRERDARGDEHLCAGRFDEALADFDAYLASVPQHAPHHWRRGIALYYAGRFADGVAQFESHRGVNPADVENATWHYLCKARLETPAAARAALLPVLEDRRVPMREVYELYAGRATPAEVLAAAGESRGALFYAHLYLGLHAEAAGDAATAKAHLDLAAERYGQDHYMGAVARMHARLLAR